jgi:hypothetical protein
MASICCPGCGNRKIIKPVKRGSRFKCSCGCREVLILVRKKGTDRAGVDAETARRQSLAGLKRHAEIKRFKPGWVAFKYRTLWGVFPDGIEAEAAPMLPELHLWVKKQGSAFAKAKKLLETAKQLSLPSAPAYSSAVMSEDDWSVRL